MVNTWALREMFQDNAAYVRIMREVKPELVGDAVPKPPGESAGRKGGAAVDEEAKAAAEEAAVSSLSRSLVFRKGTGDGRRPVTVGECVAGPWDRESTTDRSSSCFCWMAWSWLMTSSNVVPGGRLWDAIIDRFSLFTATDAMLITAVNTARLTRTMYAFFSIKFC